MQYLKNMKHDQFGANTIDDDGNISDGQLITISKQAFLKISQKVNGITDINTKWAVGDLAYKLSHSTTHRSTRVSRIGDMHNRELTVR